MTRVSVVIPNWNGLRWLEPCLSALRVQTFADFETVVVDNGSTDGSVEFLARRFPEVRVCALPQNLGFAAGMNAGIGAARGTDYIASLNNDTVVAEGWLAELVAALDADPGAGSAASTMLSLADPGIIDTLGDGYGWDGLSYKLGSGQPASRTPSARFEVFGASAGACIYRRRMLDEIGLFDESYFAYMEDVDLALRARLAGWTCVSVPGAVVLHVGAASSGADASDFSVRMTTRNLLTTILKNVPLRYLPVMIGRTMVTQLGAVALSLAVGRPAWLTRRRGAWLAGAGAGLRRMPSALAERRRSRTLRRLPAGSFAQMMSESARLRAQFRSGGP